MVNKIIISLILARVISKKMRIAFRPTKKICIIIKTNLNYKKTNSCQDTFTLNIPEDSAFSIVGLNKIEFEYF